MSALNRVLTFSVCTAVAVLMAAVAFLFHENQTLRAQLAASRTPLGTVPPLASHREVDPDSSATVAPSPLQTSPFIAERAAPSRAESKWLAGRRVQEIGHFTALTPDESSLLEARLEAEGAPPISSERGKELITELLGDERARSTLSAYESARNRAEEEQIQTETRDLSDKLQLEGGQKEQLRIALGQINSELRASFEGFKAQSERITALHEVGDAARDQLRQSFQEYEKLALELRNVKNERLQEVLRPILNEQQYNKLLEIQANQPPMFMGL